MMKYLSIAICLSLLLLLSGCAVNNSEVDKNNAMVSDNQNASSREDTINITGQSIDSSPIEKENQLPVQDQTDKNQVITESQTVNANDNDEIMKLVDSIYNNTYVGEAFPSGSIYIEQFNVDRTTWNDGINLPECPNDITFYPVEGLTETAINAVLIGPFNTYVPNIESKSHYFFQAFSEPEQIGFQYRSGLSPNNVLLGITIFGYQPENLDFSQNGQPRPYSDQEYSDSIKLIDEDHKIKAEDHLPLDYITNQDTILGARIMCSFSIKGTNLKVQLSEYRTHSTEYVAEVYVMDFYNGNQIIKSYQKANSDGPY